MPKQPRPGPQRKAAPIELDPKFPIKLGAFPKYPQNYPHADKPISLLHQHDCLEVGLWVDGSGIFMVEGEIYRYRAGDVAVTPPGVFHYAQSARGTVSHGTWFFFDPVRLLGPAAAETESLFVALGTPGFRNIVSGRKHPEVAELVRAIIRELADQGPEYRSAVRGLVLALLACLNRLVPKGDGRNAGKPAAIDRERKSILARIAPALNFLTRSYAGEIDFAELARICHMSPTNFRRLFKRVFSQSPQTYLTHLRIQAAAGMLENTDARILEIALACGFQTLSNFTRLFKRTLGTSPRAWRRKARQSPAAAAPQRLTSPRVSARPATPTSPAC